MADNPWDDPSLASEETKKLRQRTKDLRMKGPQAAGAPKKKEPALTDMAGGLAEKLTKRNKKIEVATRPLRKALPGQGQ